MKAYVQSIEGFGELGRICWIKKVSGILCLGNIYTTQETAAELTEKDIKKLKKECIAYKITLVKT